MSKLLSNSKYIGYIISFENYFAAQVEKGNRSNLDEDSNKRKATRYSSQNVLSGLLVCAECGANYRRITKPSGEVVWRCADRVEKGKFSVCKHSPTITDISIKDLIRKELNLSDFDENAVQNALSQVSIKAKAQIDIARPFEMNLQL